MPQSISQAQASALADSFLDSVGTNDKGGLVLRESADTLMQFAQDIIDKVNSNLDEGGHHSSGALSASFGVLPPEITGNKIEVSIKALDYYQYLNKGVRGTKGGSGPFSFKNDYPSLKMVQAISDWAGRSFFASRNVKIAVTKLESKHKAVGELSKMAKAYAIARSIKQKGIKGTGFFDRAVQVVQITMTDKLRAAFRIDVINALPKKIG